MNNTQRLIERLRKQCDPPTDYQIAKRLGVDPQNVYNWKKRGSAMDLVTAYTLADALGEDRATIAGMIELDRRNLSEEKRRRLERMLPRLVASTSLAVLGWLAMVGILMHGETASARVTKWNASAANTLYIMRNSTWGGTEANPSSRWRSGPTLPWPGWHGCGSLRLAGAAWLDRPRAPGASRRGRCLPAL